MSRSDFDALFHEIGELCEFSRCSLQASRSIMSIVAGFPGRGSARALALGDAAEGPKAVDRPEGRSEKKSSTPRASKTSAALTV
jgi:hypothetical protein